MNKRRLSDILMQRLNKLNIPNGIGHSFNSSVAEHLGLEVAIILNMLPLIATHPEADSDYNKLSLKEKLLMNFPYMTEEKINIALEKMKSLGFIPLEEIDGE